jgi:hypothetical protein
MSEIEIELKPKIFDGEYCENETDHCGRKEKFGVTCYQFGKFLKKKTALHSKIHIKCDECKTAYQKALKEKEVKKCPNCDTEYNINLSSWCPHCEYDIPF